MVDLKEHVTPALLKEILDFWFSHFTSPEDFVAPPWEVAARWFRRDEEFDRACVYVPFFPLYFPILLLLTQTI